jgi:ferritin-like metal-binding protein YciE
MATTLLETPTELLHIQLKTAMTMEDDSLAALAALEKAARSAKIKKMFRHHADETKEQIENLKLIFTLLDLKEATSPSPSTKGISKQAESLLKKSADVLHDRVALAAALGNEHYEISAYQSLIIPVTAMGASDVLTLLNANLDQETHTSEELKAELERISA